MFFGANEPLNYTSKEVERKGYGCIKHTHGVEYDITTIYNSNITMIISFIFIFNEIVFKI